MLHFLFAWRYFKSKKSANAINIIAWISVLAITVGTAALIIVLSVFNGFENLVKNLYGDFYSDIRMAPARGKFFSLTEKQFQQIQALPEIKQLSKVVEEKTLLVNEDFQSIVFLKGVDNHFTQVNPIQRHTERGSYSVGTAQNPKLVVGIGIANALGIDPQNTFNSLLLYVPNRAASNLIHPDEAMNSAEVHVSGLFSIQQEFDDKYAFTNLPFLQYMLNLQPTQYSAVEIALQPGASQKLVKQKLKAIVGNSIQLQTRFEQNQSLFTVMQLEKWVIYGILSLILIVAGFNMIGSLTMLVLEKQKDIAVLKAMGASSSFIQTIFLSEGLLLAGIGGIIGMIIAIAVCMAQMQWKIIKLQGGTFIIDYYPVQMQWPDFVLVGCTVAIVALLAAWLPAAKSAVQSYSLKS